jgi:hypothetical protein
MKIWKAFLVVVLVGPILALSGCGFGFHLGGDPTTDEDVPIQLLSQPGFINRPLIGGGDDWTRQPLDRTLLLFYTGTDRYGNPTGLRDDSVWTIDAVTIRCELKNVNDTVYNPGDAYRQHGFSADGFPNACVWYPTYTGEEEVHSLLPYSPAPEVQYPFNSCAPLPGDTFAEQQATITATAHASKVQVRIVVPKRDGGMYMLDIDGATPQTSNIFDVYVGAPGQIGVVWQKDETAKRYNYTVPVEWFWCTGTWKITVMATGLC